MRLNDWAYQYKFKNITHILTSRNLRLVPQPAIEARVPLLSSFLVLLLKEIFLGTKSHPLILRLKLKLSSTFTMAISPTIQRMLSKASPSKKYAEK